jgi:hypothetical protein
VSSHIILMKTQVFPTLKSEGHNYAVNGRNAKVNPPPVLRKIVPCTCLMACRNNKPAGTVNGLYKRHVHQDTKL